jgi:hypothetical protein
MVIPEGTRFGELSVLHEVERSGQNRRFRCRCSCGTEVVKFLSNMRRSQSTSCGCTYTFGAAARASIIAARRERSQESDEGRICLTCDTWKPWSSFSNDKRRARGKMSNCIDCGNFRTMKSRLGISREEWEWLHVKQGERCALCGEPENKNSRLSLDHDHSCHGLGRSCKKCIRGLLCDLCNRMLGFVEQRELNRARFLDYLAARPFVAQADAQ